MPKGPLTGAQLVQLASDFSALAEQAGEMVADPNLNLTDAQSTALTTDESKLSNIAANLAMWGAKVAFDDSDASFASISSATQSANNAVSNLRHTVAKINSVVNIVGNAVALGMGFATGNVVGIVSAAANLASAANNP
ncbi:MAG: hypothetical protein WCC84_14745 [Candidatus Cybelea sp.]